MKRMYFLSHLEKMAFLTKMKILAAYMLGDIVISVEKATAQAELYGHSFQREMGFLTVHSMLHLLGYDHEAGGLEAAKMREKEEMIPGAVRPYERYR